MCKLNPQWHGPYPILSFETTTSVRLDLPEDSRKHLSLIKHYVNSPVKLGERPELSQPQQ